MKIYLSLVLCLLLLVGYATAQQNAIKIESQGKSKSSKKNTKIYNLVEEGAEFPGGMAELFAFANKNIIYPINALNDSVYGRVTLQVIIEKDGSISNVKLMKGIRQDIDDEAIRLIKTMPKWVPGSINGEVVRTRRLIPIKFTLPPKKG